VVVLSIEQSDTTASSESVISEAGRRCGTYSDRRSADVSSKARQDAGNDSNKFRVIRVMKSLLPRNAAAIGSAIETFDRNGVSIH
jgi:hypothetical protein